ncbi:GyrI-like domain-containing protein [Methanolobus psychrotolerans]|uniref:GyrI-like domain-containing protein n=1 Tax=Methanolobus psychrotolerans TaxID=1874706 RepID=UPI000B9196D1|nr:GyrI-like domain-containing protein [Methanolobus psychrotolerans]
MKDGIEMKEEKAQPVLSIRTRAAVRDLPRIIRENYGKIMQYLEKIGQQPACAPFVAYYNMDMEDLDLEIGFPVLRPLDGSGEINRSEIPAGKYVSMMYKGPYAGMEKPYNDMMKWIGEHGYKPKGIAYEYYYNSPMEVPESELLTRIVMAIE